MDANEKLQLEQLRRRLAGTEGNAELAPPPEMMGTETVGLEFAVAANKICVEAGRQEEAEYWLDRALALDPADPILQRKKGDLHRRRNEWGLAAQRYGAAVRLRPANAKLKSLLDIAQRRARNGRAAATAGPRNARTAKRSAHNAARRTQKAAPTADVLDLTLRADGTRYIEDLLPVFGLPFVPLAQSIEMNEPHVALRHDVDTSIEAALTTARLEEEFGVRSTYFLLHPDGAATTRNYFGAVEDGALIINENLFGWAAQLRELGHEVALKNDLLGLAIATGKSPEHFLKQIIEAFRCHDMPLAGSVAHPGPPGTPRKFPNYRLFEEMRGMPIPADDRNQPDPDDDDAPGIEAFSLRMADFGLRYEANFIPCDVYIRDGETGWSVRQGETDKPCGGGDMPGVLAEALRARRPRSAVQCATHVNHWQIVSAQGDRQEVRAKALQRNDAFIAKRREAMLERVQALDNVLVARLGDPRFVDCDTRYGSSLQVFGIATSVDTFLDKVMAAYAAQTGSLFEVGCGQGDFIADIRGRVERATGKAPYALGMDGSMAAILTSAGRYPALDWAADELERFLVIHDELVRDDTGAPRRWDMVLDKTGTIFIATYEEGRDYFARIQELMSAGGLYVYVAAKRHYDQYLCQRVYNGWPKHWIELADECFEPALNDDDPTEDRGYYKRVYRKRPSGKA